MRRVALFAFVLLAGAVHAGPEESAVQIVRLTFADDENGIMGPRTNYGSGTVVWQKDGKALILTCRHVVPDDQAYVWVRSGSTLYEGQFVAADEAADLSLLRATAKLPAAPVADADPKAGTDLRQWGHPFAGRARAKHGAAVGDEGYKDAAGRPVWDAAYGSDPGDSGAGVFDPAGRLVAVCRIKFQSSPDKAGCVFPADVRKFLAAHLPK